jgi:hypothetical protein
MTDPSLGIPSDTTAPPQLLHHLVGMHVPEGIRQTTRPHDDNCPFRWMGALHGSSLNLLKSAEFHACPPPQNQAKVSMMTHSGPGKPAASKKRHIWGEIELESTSISIVVKQQLGRFVGFKSSAVASTCRCIHVDAYKSYSIRVLDVARSE